MSFSKNLTITVRNTVAQLDEPLYVYEKDRNLIMYFKIMDYKYKFDKNPTNVLASVDDIMEAYATIVDPNGYELTRQYGEVIEDEIKFIITDDLIDELDEIGTYRIQFHIKCQHSEFTIPEISFEVLERLKGFKTVTDEGEVGDEILNNSESFIDAEGKLHLVWQEGDTISSVRLNQMVQVINNAVDEEHQRQINEVNRENRANAKLEELETRFSALTTSQQQSAEVIDARDGEASLKARLDRDIEKAKQVYVNVEGSYITTDSSSGYLKDVEILGNTVQDASNLADIRSVGDKVEGQELHEIPVLSCGKNIFNSEVERGCITDSGELVNWGNYVRSKSFMRVSPNTNYIGHMKYNGQIKERGYYVEYDKDFNFIKTSFSNNGITTSDSSCYIKLILDSNSDPCDLTLVSDIQLEEGTVATPYEPYQEDKLTILSTVQLEKVGDVADRIIEKNGVLGVEKNIVTIVFDGSENWVLSGWARQKNTIAFKLQNIKNTNLGICDKFILNRTNSTIDTEAFNVDSVWNEISIRINKSKLSTQDVTGFKKWLSDNTVLVMYSDNTSTFIPLPHDQQVKLRTFANKTNISFLTEIEGTLVAQVPKSLGATVNIQNEQISNLNKELDRVKKLEESTVSTVETESDFTTVEATSNGYFEDVKLEGKTLVNLWGNKSSDFLYSGQTSFNSSTQCIEYTSTTNRFSNCFTKNNTQYKPDTKYTIIVNVFENTFTTTAVILKVSSDPSGGSDLGVSRETINIQGGFVGVKVFTITTLSDLSNSRIAIRTYVDNVNAEVGVKLKFKMIILEGDHTQNPPSYFEGLKSVGDGTDEIVVSSCNGNYLNNNKFVKHLKNVASGILDSKNKTITFDGANAEKIHYKFNDLPNGSYTIAFKGYNTNTNNQQSNLKLIYTDGTFEHVGVFANGYAIKEIKNKTLSEISGAYMTSTTVLYYDECYLIKSNNLNYIYKQDKKPILYYNPETQTWEKPILREWDSIEKHSDGKYYYHQRSGEVVLNGSESWVVTATTENFIDFRFSHSESTLSGDKSGICDKFEFRSNKNGSWICNEEGVTILANIPQFLLTINKSRLSTQDVAGFKAWLQSNNVTVVYQLAEEKVYECANIDLITYANETNYIVESGAITPKSSLKVMCNINNVVRELQQKVSNLEGYIQHVMIDALNNALNE